MLAPMTSALGAMGTWIGALVRGGTLMGDEEEEGVLLALEVLGEDRLGALRAHYAQEPREVVERERKGAIEACIWMAHANRVVAPEEQALLRKLVSHSDLSESAQAHLLETMGEPSSPARIAEEVTYPALRELLLALAWSVARADGRIDDDERGAHRTLAEAFGVGEERAEEIRELVLAL